MPRCSLGEGSLGLGKERMAISVEREYALVLRSAGLLLGTAKKPKEFGLEI